MVFVVGFSKLHRAHGVPRILLFSSSSSSKFSFYYLLFLRLLRFESKMDEFGGRGRR